MLLAIDVGNTQTVFGLFDGDAPDRAVPRRHRPAHTADELAVMLRAFVELERARRDRALARRCRSSCASTRRFAERWAGAELLVLGPGVSTGVPIRYDDPREVGPDRIANAVAARERHGAPAIVVDFGTSTNFDVVSAAGEYVGGVLAPGIEISMDALFARAARLTKVPFAAPERVIGKTTVAALQSGLVYGFAGQVDAIVDRIREELGAPDAPVDRHGRPRRADRAALATITEVDPELTLQGLRLVWERNRLSSDPPIGARQPTRRLRLVAHYAGDGRVTQSAVTDQATSASRARSSPTAAVARRTA